MNQEPDHTLKMAPSGAALGFIIACLIFAALVLAMKYSGAPAGD